MFSPSFRLACILLTWQLFVCFFLFFLAHLTQTEEHATNIQTQIANLNQKLSDMSLAIERLLVKKDKAAIRLEETCEFDDVHTPTPSPGVEPTPSPSPSPSPSPLPSVVDVFPSDGKLFFHGFFFFFFFSFLSFLVTLIFLENGNSATFYHNCNDGKKLFVAICSKWIIFPLFRS